MAAFVLEYQAYASAPSGTRTSGITTSVSLVAMPKRTRRQPIQDAAELERTLSGTTSELVPVVIA
jgi:hypothetical protein